MKSRNLWVAFSAAVLTFLFCAMALAATSPSSTGSYSVCSYTPPSNIGYLAAKVYYPCNASGTRGATTLTGGFTNTYNDMAWLSTHLASWGYIVYAMTPINNLGTNEQWTAAHLAGVSMLKKENTRSGSAIRGKVDTAKLQIMGFSKGGGGALLASAASGSGVKTTQALAPYMDYAYSLLTVKAKTICYTGATDVIANPTSVVTMYSSLPLTIDRTLAYFTSFLHTDWMTGSYANTNGTKGKKYVTAFMKYQLDGDSSYQTYLYGAQNAIDKASGMFVSYRHNY